MDTKVNCSSHGSKLEGKYANFFEIGYNAYEFVFDFGQCFPENDHATISSRIVTSPAYARALLELLEKSIAEYGDSFGSMED
jgi:hypothetical protein